MAFESDLHHRRSIRLRSYDYAQPGMYYLTICAYQKRSLFGHISDGQMTLNALGEVVRNCWQAIPKHYDEVRLDEYVVMPNHIHGIVVIRKDGRNVLRPYEEAAGDDTSLAGYRQAKAWEAMPAGIAGFAASSHAGIGAIVRIFKAAATRDIRRSMGNGIVVWQRNYYERIIRGESEMNAARDYIRRNPANWSRDKENVP